MRTSMKSVIRWVVIGVLSLLAVFGIMLSPAHAGPGSPTPAPAFPTSAPTALPTSPSDQYCLVCHSRTNLTTQLPSGDSLYLTIDPAAFNSSIHGKASPAIHCVSCHTTITSYPHPVLAAQNLREVAISLSQSCQSCHPAEFAKQQDSIHQQALAGGNENAAVCSDCHNPHYTSLPADPRAKIVATCGTCHSGVAQQYSESVHGTALLNNNNPDVPSCIDCHGVHNIPNPLTPQFLLNSPQLCAKCHTNAQMMAKYNLNTNVLNTYVADFHGTTTTLFRQQSPDQLPNQALCIDCHGTHDIKSVSDPNSSIIKQNLLATCQQCHPNATANFPAAWLSHYTPSPTHDALVYYIGLFYKIIIPLVIGGMLVFVISDLGRRIARKVHAKGGRH